MGVSSSRSTLYLTSRCFVILGGRALVLARTIFVLTLLVQTGPAQIAGGAKVKGPRALGLVELAPNGKAHLIPITILYNGKFYDAGAYKASPVPMALELETVYEGIRTGVSQGLFTVTAALEEKATNTWIGEGTWLPAGSIPPKSANKTSASSRPRGMDDDEGPPKLRRSTPEKAKPPETAPSAPTQPAAPQTTPSSGSGTAPSTSPASSPQAAPAATAPASSAAPPTDQEGKDQEDKDRPALRRGKPAPKPPESLGKPLATPPKTAAHPPTTPAASPASQIQQIPAISDADGPEPRPYTYSLKPEEEQQFRSQMLTLAAEEIRARAKQLAGETIASAPSRASSPRAKPSAAKSVQPNFEDVQLRVFDLSNSNEPEAVLTARARLPQRTGAKENAAPDLQYFVTLVARQDINGDFHKALANVTDTQHLDVLPRFELIDAVDADGDGRGELLFRQVSDAGTAFVVYRVIGNQLWPLFQGTP